MIRPLAAALVLAFAATPALAQEAPAPAVAPAHVPNPADVETLDGIMAALYDVISGPAGPRDWDRFRGLFLPGAMMGGSGPAREGVSRLRLGTPDDYARNSGAYFMENAFFEREVGRKVQAWGPLTQVLTAYETAETEGGPATQRGVNSVTLFNDGKRWWITSITWAGEASDRPMPADW